jgi:hypothetical protein
MYADHVWYILCSESSNDGGIDGVAGDLTPHIAVTVTAASGSQCPQIDTGNRPPGIFDEIPTGQAAGHLHIITLAASAAFLGIVVAHEILLPVKDTDIYRGKMYLIIFSYGGRLLPE